eukprot:m.367784 g.367784  ORF g.367784 m.367784 type:complete len:299 (-) comp56087_c1_seq9:1447-2343(-)
MSWAALLALLAVSVGQSCVCRNSTVDSNSVTYNCSSLALKAIPACVPTSTVVLDLRNNSLTVNTKTTIFAPFPHLRTLYLSGNPIVNISARVFSGLSNLTTLDICGVTPKLIMQTTVFKSTNVSSFGCGAFDNTTFQCSQQCNASWCLSACGNSSQCIGPPTDPSALNCSCIYGYKIAANSSTCSQIVAVPVKVQATGPVVSIVLMVLFIIVLKWYNRDKPAPPPAPQPPPVSEKVAEPSASDQESHSPVSSDIELKELSASEPTEGAPKDDFQEDVQRLKTNSERVARLLDADESRV